MYWEFAYAVGFHPWEDAVDDEPFVRKFEEMLGREEQGRDPPFGTALDLGTGSAIWGVKLAQRGWQVTGIDIVEKVLVRARQRVEQAGVDMKLVLGSVTELKDAGVGSGFRLFLDTGTFHDLSEEQRMAMGREVTAVAASDATLLLLVWPKQLRLPLIRGASRGDVERAFPEWTVTHIEPSHFRLPKPLQAIIRPDEQWYRLRRT